MVSVIAAHMRNKREYKTLTELFDKADVSGDGAVTMEEFLDVAKHFGIKLTEEELMGFMNIAKNGKVYKADFIQHLKVTSLSRQFSNVNPESDEKWNNIAKTAFKIFDANGDGFVDKREFKLMTSSKKINNKIIDLVFERSDWDRDGKLDFEEFKALIFRSKLSKSESMFSADSGVEQSSSSSSSSRSWKLSKSGKSDSAYKMCSSSSAHSNMSTEVSFSLSSNKIKSRKTWNKLGYEEVYQEDYNEPELEANTNTNNPRKSVKKLQQLKTNIYEFLEERISKILSTKGR